MFYIYIVIGDTIIREDGLKRRRVGIPLTGLTPPHFDACLNPGFPTLCHACFSVQLFEVRGVVHLVVDLHYLNFLFITLCDKVCIPLPLPIT